MFYQFRQNNSGGSFHISESEGIGIRVIIEANDADHANARAEEIGLYFDGCENDIDCECCGDRWYRAWDDDGSETPKLYGDEVTDGDDVYIHYLDGTVVYR